MADRVADQRLPPQQQEIARQRAGHRGQHPRSGWAAGRRPRSPSPPLGPSRASSAATWSGVSTRLDRGEPVVARGLGLVRPGCAQQVPAPLVQQRLGRAGAARFGRHPVGGGQAPRAPADAVCRGLVHRQALRQRQQPLAQMHRAAEAQLPDHRRQHPAPGRQRQRQREERKRRRARSPGRWAGPARWPRSPRPDSPTSAPRRPRPAPPPRRCARSRAAAVTRRDDQQRHDQDQPTDLEPDHRTARTSPMVARSTRRVSIPSVAGIPGVERHAASSAGAAPAPPAAPAPRPPR